MDRRDWWELAGLGILAVGVGLTSVPLACVVVGAVVLLLSIAGRILDR